MTRGSLAPLSPSPHGEAELLSEQRLVSLPKTPSTLA
jgi:hypothetical protein